MLNHKINYLLIFLILLFLYGCVKFGKTSNSPSPAKTITKIVPPATQAIAKASPSFTKTIIEATPSSTPTSTIETNVGILDFCGQKKDPNICISSIQLTNNNRMSLVIFFTNTNLKSYYLVFDGTKYDCAPAAGNPEIYYCLDLPVVMNKSVFAQVFIYAPSSLFAEGTIYINEAYLYTPVPTSMPTSESPNPYTP
jgi:hypothetical protein